MNGESEGEEAPQLDPGVELGWQLHHRLFKPRQEQGLWPAWNVRAKERWKLGRRRWEGEGLILSSDI